jgi:uncharacterized protein (TIGR01777 family)
VKILIFGGTGPVGKTLCRHFLPKRHDVAIVSRNSGVLWDGKAIGPWARELESADVVINLAGKSVNCRYTEENLREMMDSRIDSTRVVGQAISAAKNPPAVWLQMSTATIYAHRFDASNDEITGIIAGHEPDAPARWLPSIEIAKAWEAETEAAETPKTRKVILRSAMVMSIDKGGVFDQLATVTKRGFGGAIAGGKQYMSWIHELDFCRALEFLIERDDMSGPVNLASPNPLPHKEFMRELRHTLGVPFGLPATAWMMDAVCRLIGSDSELLLKSRRVVPTRLLEAGFDFRFVDWEAACRDLAKRMLTNAN